MKYIALLVLSLSTLFVRAQLSQGDYSISQKVNATGPLTERKIPGGAGYLWGTDSVSNIPARITLGTGITRTGNTLSVGAVSLSDGVTGLLPLSNGGTNASTAGQARTNLGLGTLATQNGTISDYLLSATAASTYEPVLVAGSAGQYYRGDKTWQTLNASAVGLGSVLNAAQLTVSNNLSDLNNVVTARTNLGLGTLATQNGTISDYLLSATAASTYAPLASPTFTGTVNANQFAAHTGSLSGQLGFGSLLLRYDASTGFGYTISASPASAFYLLFLPQSSGSLISTGDTGTVTSTVLADGTIVNADISASAAITLSKLSTTGTASSSTFLRGDATWATIDLSSYAPLSSPTFSGTVTIPSGASISGYQTTAGTLALAGFGSVTGVLGTANGGTGLSALGTGISTALGNTPNATGGLLTYAIVGTSGAAVPLLNGTNTWSSGQTFSSAVTFKDGVVNVNDAGMLLFGSSGNVVYNYAGTSGWKVVNAGNSADLLTLTNAGNFSVAGHVTLEGVTSTGATGVGKLVFDTAPQIATIELGHATDTTLSRPSAGVLEVEGVSVLLSGGALGTPTSGNFSTGSFTWPTFNQSTTGSAATLTTARTIYGNSFDGSAALTQIIASTYGGTGNGFTKFSGPTTSERTKTLRDASDTILELGGSYTPTGAWNWSSATLSGIPTLTATNTFTGVQLLPDGTDAAPAAAFANDTNTGIRSSGADLFSVVTGGVHRIQFGVVSGVGTSTLYTSSGSAVYTASGGGAQLGSSTVNASLTPFWTVTAASGRFASSNRAYEFALGGDCIISGDAAAVFQLGTDSTTPITQRVCGPDGTGTNIAGGSIGLQSGTSTGTGAGGDVFVETSMSSSSGSTANSVQERSRIIGRVKDLTEGTATNLASIALASGKVTGGTATITVWASDGTDYQALTSEIRFSAVNKAGTITATVSQTDGTTAASAGTLTVTYDATQSGSAILLRANATSSLTQTVLRSRMVFTAINGDDTQTITPQ